jgi:hypothetical protein
MLSRPDVGTKEHIVSWLMTKNETETYEWASGHCPAAHYSMEFGDEHTGLNLEYINKLAEQKPHTWGALAERASK